MEVKLARIRLREKLAVCARSRVRTLVLPDVSEESRIRSGKQYRWNLIRRFALGKLYVADVVTDAYWHTRSGGLGAPGLALDPKSAQVNAAARLRRALDIRPDELKYIIYVPFMDF